MPAELIQKIIDAKNYLAAYWSCPAGFLRAQRHGMAQHHGTGRRFGAPISRSRRRPKRRYMPYVDGQCTATSFGHIFSGGYAAGYYSYKWAEVLEADAFSLFKEKGIFSRDVAGSFRENVLSKGGTEHPMNLYVRFRGHKPDTEALFEKMGIGKVVFFRPPAYGDKDETFVSRKPIRVFGTLVLRRHGSVRVVRARETSGRSSGKPARDGSCFGPARELLPCADSGA